MDYAACYERFIASRRLKEKELKKPFEKHHIVPKCMGGSNKAENIIRLTPEDHFFAHLLLAKAHGGLMWAAVSAMRGKPKRRCRWSVGVARRKWSEEASRRRKGHVATKETRKKIGQATASRMTPEMKSRLSEKSKGNQNWKGRRHTEEAKKKISEAAKRREPHFGNKAFSGRKHTDETKAKMAQSARERWQRNKGT